MQYLLARTSSIKSSFLTADHDARLSNVKCETPRYIVYKLKRPVACVQSIVSALALTKLHRSIRTTRTSAMVVLNLTTVALYLQT